MPLLTDEEIAARAAAVQAAADQRLTHHAQVEMDRTASYKYVHPLVSTYESVLESIRTSEQRFSLGLAELDVRTRGFGPKELILVTGFAHSGKTQLVNTAILNNRDKRVLFFSMDDPAEMILLKLVCMLHDVDAETLERRIREGDAKAKHMLHEAATLTFENLIVVDDSLDLVAMTRAIEEATAYWGAPPECVIIDYLGSMQGGDMGDEGIKSKVAGLKGWVKDKPFPTVVIHQNTRSRGAPGEPITLLSGGYGGEQEATILIGVRRKRDAQELEPYERDNHQNTVTIHVVKNKRPPGKTTPPDGIDFYMNPATGLIRPMHDDDRPVIRHGLTSAQDALRARDAQG